MNRWLAATNACQEAVDEFQQYDSLEQVWDNCNRWDWLLWFLSVLGGDYTKQVIADVHRRRLTRDDLSADVIREIIGVNPFAGFDGTTQETRTPVAGRNVPVNVNEVPPPTYDFAHCVHRGEVLRESSGRPRIRLCGSSCGWSKFKMYECDLHVVADAKKCGTCAARNYGYQHGELTHGSDQG